MAASRVVLFGGWRRRVKPADRSSRVLVPTLLVAGKKPRTLRIQATNALRSILKLNWHIPVLLRQPVAALDPIAHGDLQCLGLGVSRLNEWLKVS